MRKVIVTEWMSLDGVVQAPGAADEDTTGGFAPSHRSSWLPAQADQPRSRLAR